MKGHGQDISAAHIQFRNRRVGGKLLAVSPQTKNAGSALAHPARGDFTREKLLDMLAVDAAKPLWDQHVERQADGLGARIAESLFGAVVENRNALILIERNDGVGSDGYDAGEFCLRQTERLIGAFALRDVFDLRNVVKGRTVLPRRIDALSRMSTIVPSLRM